MELEVGDGADGAEGQELVNRFTGSRIPVEETGSEHHLLESRRESFSLAVPDVVRERRPADGIGAELFPLFYQPVDTVADERQGITVGDPVKQSRRSGGTNPPTSLSRRM